MVDAKKHDAERIYVKFRDAVPVRLREGKPAAAGANANAMSAATGVLSRLAAAGAKWERQHSVAEEKLDEMRDKAQRNTGKAMADLNNAYILRVPKGVKADQFIDELNALDSVEIAQPMALPSPDPVAGNYQPQQGYLNAAPGGVDADFAWTQLAGAGGNVWIADIESNWNFNHADLNSPTLIGPVSALTAQNNIDHGTAVLGVLAARNNGVGTTGIAYNSTLFVAARQTASGYDPAAAITRCTAALRAGDIIVLEMQTDGPAAGNADLVPIEWEAASYTAIQTAVGLGIIVVEAAGNGSQNLDAAIFNTGHAPFLAANDSGAIIVGAGAVPGGSDTDRSRLGFTSYGSTVDLQGWGENVVTTGYGDLYLADGMNSFYTAPPAPRPPSPARVRRSRRTTKSPTSARCSRPSRCVKSCAPLARRKSPERIPRIKTSARVRTCVRRCNSFPASGRGCILLTSARRTGASRSLSIPCRRASSPCRLPRI